MNTTPSIQWVRVLLVALLIEVTLLVVTIPIYVTLGVQVFVGAVVVAIFVIPFLLTRWATRKIRDRVVLHGFLIGVVATLMYLGLSFGQSGSIQPAVDLYGRFIFTLANCLRILGTVLGAASEKRRRTAAIVLA